MGEPTPAPTPETPSPMITPSRRKLLIALVAGFICVLIITVVLVAYLALRNLLPGEGSEPSVPSPASSPTPIQTTAMPASPVATPQPGCETVINSGSVQAPVPFPTSLTVGTQAFRVSSVVAGGESGVRESVPPGSVAWVCGTVVNYVFVLEPVAENQTLLAALESGDEITLELSDGMQLVFRAGEHRELAASDESVFEQSQPGLTLVLQESADIQRVVLASYVSEREPSLPPSDSLAQPNEPVRVGDAQITVITGRAEYDPVDLGLGTMYYVVEFSIENLGTVPLEVSRLDMRLHDGVGNEYLLSPAASAIGDRGSLSGAIAAGNTAQGTAGYVVPESLSGPILIWTFSPRPSSELRASVRIPYVEPETVIPAVHLEVRITGAYLDDGDDVLVIEGELRYEEETAPLTVEASDISLTSSLGAADLLMTAPGLPWTLRADQMQVFELRYRRPETPVAVLSLLGYSFEIEGLP